MKGCYFSLLRKTWSEICGRGQNLKGECELILNWIESIFWTRLKNKNRKNKVTNEAQVK